MTEPLIRAKRLAYVRVNAPDLAKAEAFLAEFGLLEAARNGSAVYFRGTDAAPPCYVLTQGDAKVTAIAFEADTASDLSKNEPVHEVDIKFTCHKPANVRCSGSGSSFDGDDGHYRTPDASNPA